ncbi:C2H2-type zinc finger protein [Halorubrum sp. Ea8]|uniref:C2H2-type zinc finger protein n=1 Tax=Halorubrum sp. Ea8 TaxID=1383841 RepID=UPI0015953775|nr:C2H2-type zinc finger protein [Halorubrum sp. Ea8]
MPYLQKSTDPTTLINKENKPNLSCSVPFRHVIESFPEQFPIPASIIKLGLLTRHLEAESERYEVDTMNIDIESTSTTVVPPQTLARIRWLLSNYTSDLTDPEKDRIGDLCSASGLNRPPEMGSDDIQEIKATSKTAIDSAIFDLQSSKNFECEYCGDEYDSIAALNGHLANCDDYEKEYTCSKCGESFSTKRGLKKHKKEDCEENQSSESSSKKRPSFGKEIRKDRGSERVSGRSPFADPKKLKDTGLHQGGG